MRGAKMSESETVFDNIDGDGTTTWLMDGKNGHGFSEFLNEIEMCDNDTEFVIRFNPDVQPWGRWEWRRHILMCPSRYYEEPAMDEQDQGGVQE